MSASPSAGCRLRDVLRAASAAFLLAFAMGCASTAASEVAAVHRRGLVSFDREPPAGVETFARPEWKAGDRFVYLRGGKLRVGGHVDARAEGGWDLVDETSGLVLHLDPDLGELGQGLAEPSAQDVRFDPVDARFAWPLWVGKRWVCEFVRFAEDEDPLPLIAGYRCDALEEVTVPAGTFRCLRIWRTVGPALKGNFIERVTVLWYSPEVGNIVRRLDDGIETVLFQFQRQ